MDIADAHETSRVCKKPTARYTAIKQSKSVRIGEGWTAANSLKTPLDMHKYVSPEFYTYPS